MKTMICLVLDRSGSMRGRESDVIGGVNTFIEEQKKLPDPAMLAMVRFDEYGGPKVERFRPMIDLKDVEPITIGDFEPRGNTPLLDAVGMTIAGLDDDWKVHSPDRCIMVIVTDGQENASKEYTKAKIKQLITARQDSGKWAFIYLGADVDAFSEAGGMGIIGANAAGYVKTAGGIKNAYAASGQAVRTMRATGQMVADNLGKNLGEDDPQPAVVDNTAWVPPK